MADAEDGGSRTKNALRKWFACPACKKKTAFNARDMPVDVYVCATVRRIRMGEAGSSSAAVALKPAPVTPAKKSEEMSGSNNPSESLDEDNGTWSELAVEADRSASASESDDSDDSEYLEKRKVAADHSENNIQYSLPKRKLRSHSKGPCTETRSSKSRKKAKKKRTAMDLLDTDSSEDEQDCALTCAKSMNAHFELESNKYVDGIPSNLFPTHVCQTDPTGVEFDVLVDRTNEPPFHFGLRLDYCRRSGLTKIMRNDGIRNPNICKGDFIVGVNGKPMIVGNRPKSFQTVCEAIQNHPRTESFIKLRILRKYRVHQQDERYQNYHLIPESVHSQATSQNLATDEKAGPGRKKKVRKISDLLDTDSEDDEKEGLCSTFQRQQSNSARREDESLRSHQERNSDRLSLYDESEFRVPDDDDLVVTEEIHNGQADSIDMGTSTYEQHQGNGGKIVGFAWIRSNK